MKKITTLLTGALLLCAAPALLAQNVKKPKVLFIGIDGVRSDASCCRPIRPISIP